MMLKQWFLKIKEFQQPLLEDLDALGENGNWPERVLAQQRNWLGRSEGTKLWFQVQPTNGAGERFEPIEVFTTRADTLFGVQFISLSLDHPIVVQLAKQDEALHAFREQAKELLPDSKAGFRLKNISARNPLSEVVDNFNPDIPVYVAPYVLSDYGSGAVMGVPGHDSRDYAFWRVNASDEPIRQVISAESAATPSVLPGQVNVQVYEEKGFVSAGIPDFQGMPSENAIHEIVKRLKQRKIAAEKTENWRLRDWLISRQRYWGTPIPIVHCGSCGVVPVRSTDLPVALPKLSETDFKGKTGNPLENHPSWKHTTCPKCGSAAKRETDTMDTFMDSSWYFFRFLSPDTTNMAVQPQIADQLMPVDIYIGGVEHAILHLLYARFIAKFLATTSLWPKGELFKGEPFKKLITQGMVHGKTYTDANTGRFLKPEEVDVSKSSAPVIRATGESPKVSFEKMSKSKYNGVDPETTIRTYGADVTRAHMLFQAPVSDVLEWDETKITGVERWLTRIVRLSNVTFMPPHFLKKFHAPKDLDRPLLDILHHLHEVGTFNTLEPQAEMQLSGSNEEKIVYSLKPEEQVVWAKLQETIANVTKSYAETNSLNTIISDLMTLTNTIWDAPHTSDIMSHLKYYATANLLRLLAPVAPAVAEESWEALHTKTNAKIKSDFTHPLRYNGGPSIFAFGFPIADTKVMPLLNTKTTCVFQLDGKKKFEVDIRKVPGQIKTNELGRVAAFVFDELLKTEQGKEWLGKENGRLWGLSVDQETHPVFEQIPKGWHAVIVKRGKLVNIVSPKRKKEEHPTQPETVKTLELSNGYDSVAASPSVSTSEDVNKEPGSAISLNANLDANIIGAKEEQQRQKQAIVLEEGDEVRIESAHGTPSVSQSRKAREEMKESQKEREARERKRKRKARKEIKVNTKKKQERRKEHNKRRENAQQQRRHESD